MPGCTQSTHTPATRNSRPQAVVASNAVAASDDADVFRAFSTGKPLVGDTTRCVITSRPGVLHGQPHPLLSRSYAAVLYSHGTPIAVNSLDYLGAVPIGATMDADPRLVCGRRIGRLTKHRLDAATACVDAAATYVRQVSHPEFMAILTGLGLTGLPS